MEATELAGLVSGFQPVLGAARKITPEYVARVTGLVLSTNTGMIRFARGLGFTARPEPDDATLTKISLELAARH